MLPPRINPSAIEIRSASDRKRADTGCAGPVVAGYVRTLPARIVIERPYRQRLTGLAVDPTIRHAAALLMPGLMRLIYRSRSLVRGSAPGDLRGRRFGGMGNS